MYSPTAAFRLLARKIKKATKIMLRAQAMMFAMFEMEPSEPAFGIPHSGLTPTGAVVESLERPVNRDGAVLKSCVEG